MKTAYAVAALLLFSTIVKADDARIACGGADFATAPVGLHMDANHVFTFFSNGAEDKTFAVTTAQDSIIASNAKSKERGADVQHIQYIFKGNCIDQSVKATKSLVGGFAGTLPGGELSCTCDFREN